MTIPWSTDNNLSDEEFYNHIDDLNLLHNILDSSQYGSTPTILLTGARGVGKTALINKLKNNFKNEYLVISIDLSSSDSYQQKKLDRTSFMELLYNEIIKSYNESALTAAPDKKIEKYFKRHDICLNKEIKYNGISDFNDNYKKLSDFVMDLPQQIYEDYSDIIKGVFIFIDEFQIIKDLDELSSFLWYLRSKVQSQKNVAYLFCGSMSIQDSLIGDIAGKNGAFGGRMLTVDIKPFSFETTKRYLNEKASYLNFTEDGFERFYKCTNGIPSYINTFARLLSNDITLDENNVKSEFKKALPFLAINLINQWSRLTLKEQKIITQLISSPLRRIEIANNLNITSGSISKELVNLQNNVLIEMNEEGKYQICESVLKHWLKNEYAKKGVFPYKI